LYNVEAGFGGGFNREAKNSCREKKHEYSESIQCDPKEIGCDETGLGAGETPMKKTRPPGKRPKKLRLRRGGNAFWKALENKTAIGKGKDRDRGSLETKKRAPP